MEFLLVTLRDHYVQKVYQSIISYHENDISYIVFFSENRTFEHVWVQPRIRRLKILSSRPSVVLFFIRPPVSIARIRVRGITAALVRSSREIDTRDISPYVFRDENEKKQEFRRYANTIM